MKSLFSIVWVETVQRCELICTKSQNGSALDERIGWSDDERKLSGWVKCQDFWSFVLTLNDIKLNFFVLDITCKKESFNSSGWLT